MTLTMLAGAVVLSLALAAVAAADQTPPPGPIETGVRRELDRLAAVDAAITGTRQRATPARARNWVQRHPKATAALVGAGAGFLIGYLPGDDGVFYDFTAGFNGAVLAGVGAGAGVSLVAIAQAIRR